MFQKTIIISTCGISTLLNSADPDDVKLLNRNTNAQEPTDIPDQELSIIDGILEVAKEKATSSNPNDIAKLSAEFNAIHAFYNNKNPEKHEHILICTDTWLAFEAANILKGALEQFTPHIQIKQFDDLQTKDLNTFRSSLSDIVKWCSETLKDYSQEGYKIIFNLTGGFKSFQGFMQTLAMFYADEVIYIFENKEQLLRIPSLPIEMKDAQSIFQNLKTFRQLHLGITTSQEEISKLPGIYILQIEDSISLSAWGEIVWSQEYEKIYRQKIYESPSPLIYYSSQFIKSTKNLDANRCYDLNKKIDLLARYLHNGRKDMLKGLDLKTLRGNSKPPSTHEFDAWADKGAWRVFCHYEGKELILDELTEGIH